ncbi:MAG: hypothetical protein R3B90_12615 [Planctomycetaceae bacterium]
MQDSLADDDLEEATRAARIKGLAANFGCTFALPDRDKYRRRVPRGKPHNRPQLLDRCNLEISKAMQALADEIPHEA